MLFVASFYFLWEGFKLFSGLVWFRIGLGCKQQKNQLMVSQRGTALSWATGSLGVSGAGLAQRQHDALSSFCFAMRGRLPWCSCLLPQVAQVARGLLQLQTLCPCPRQKETARPKDQSLSFKLWLFIPKGMPSRDLCWHPSALAHMATHDEGSLGCPAVCLEEGKGEEVCEWLFHSRSLVSAKLRV